MVVRNSPNPPQPTGKLCYKSKAKFVEALFGEVYGEDLLFAVKCAVRHFCHVTNILYKYMINLCNYCFLLYVCSLELSLCGSY